MDKTPAITIQSLRTMQKKWLVLFAPPTILLFLIKFGVIQLSWENADAQTELLATLVVQWGPWAMLLMLTSILAFTQMVIRHLRAGTW